MFEVTSYDLPHCYTQAKKEPWPERLRWHSTTYHTATLKPKKDPWPERLRWHSSTTYHYDAILDGIIDDSEDKFNNSFPKETRRSNLRFPGGIDCPDISMMTDEEGAKVIKKWKGERKAFTD